MLIVNCGEELDGYRCEARHYANGISRDVTGFATWSTSDTSIATVNSVGWVTATRAGEVAIRAIYDGIPGFSTMQVRPEGLRYYYRALSGWVRDAQTDAVLTDVRVEIIDGVNEGRVSTTGSSGAYQFYDLQPGAFTVQFVKTGYIPAHYGFNLTGDRYNSLDARMTR